MNEWMNFKYIINLHSVALHSSYYIQKLDVTESINNFFSTSHDSLLCHKSVDLLNCKYHKGSIQISLHMYPYLRIFCENEGTKLQHSIAKVK